MERGWKIFLITGILIVFIIAVFSSGVFSGMIISSQRCVENGDDGDDPFVYGYVSYRASPWSREYKIFEDRCSYGGQKLIESFCNERGGIGIKTYDKNNGCANGCINGVCVKGG